MPSSTHPVLTNIRQAATTVRTLENGLTNAYYAAEGVAADHPESPSVLAAFKHRRLALFQIDQSVLDDYKRAHTNATTDAERTEILTEFNTLINAIIVRAWTEWHEDFNNRLPSTK